MRIEIQIMIDAIFFTKHPHVWVRIETLHADTHAEWIRYTHVCGGELKFSNVTAEEYEKTPTCVRENEICIVGKHNLTMMHPRTWARIEI